MSIITALISVSWKLIAIISSADAFTITVPLQPSSSSTGYIKSPRTQQRVIVNVANEQSAAASKESGRGSRISPSSNNKRRRSSSNKNRNNSSSSSSDDGKKSKPRRGRTSSQRRRNSDGRSKTNSRSNKASGRGTGGVDRSNERMRRSGKAPVDKTTSEEQAEFRAKLQEMHDKDGKGVKLSQSYCDEMLGLCVAADEWDSVLEVLTVMQNQGLSQIKSSYRACLEQCSKVNNGASANEILAAMRQAGIEPDPDDVGLVVKTLCRSGSWRRAKGLLLETVTQRSSMEGSDDAVPSEMSIEAYNAIISAMKEDGMWKEALQFLSLMEKGHAGTNNNKQEKKDDKAASSNPHPKPSLVTYNHALEACVISAEAEQAVGLLMAMRDKGMEPSSHTLELVVRGLLKRRAWRRALEILKLTEEWGIPQSTRIYNNVISACAKSREIGEAMDLLKRMKKSNIKPDVVTYNAILSACASAGRWKDALSLLQQCQREPGVDPDIITYTNAMRACARARKYKDALDLLGVLQDLGLKPDVYCYTAAIDACAKGRMWRRALDILDEMRQNEVAPNEITYSVAITACGNGGQWQRALELLQQMRDKGMRINVITYSSTISALAKGARRNMKELPSGSQLSRSSTGRRRADPSGSTAGEELWIKALDLLDQMKKEGVEPDAYSYSGAISACASAGRWKEALDLMSTMKKGGPKTRPNKITYTAAISACGRAGEWEHALRLFEEMRNDGLQADRISYNAVVSALRIGLQADKAFEIWGEMCGRKGKHTDIRDSGGSKAIATATTDPRLSPDIITLTDVIATLDRSKGDKNRERMDQVFDEAVQRGIILPSDSLDSLWEVDLSGMSIPVAHAACRHIVRRALRAVQSGSPFEDLVFITGVGKAQQQLQQDIDFDLDTVNEDDEEADPQLPPLGRKGQGTTALREYVRQVLRDDFDPPLYSTIPAYGQGTVHVGKKVFEKWIDAQ